MELVLVINILICLVGSGLILYFSRRSIIDPKSHGFYRFFAWELILIMFSINWKGWFKDPFNWHQLVSWLFLGLSLFYIFSGVFLLKKIGKPTDSLEATTHLVRTGIYRYIRHPLYASLLYLAWGIFFKSPSLLDLCLVLPSSIFLFLTALADERECLIKFGNEYLTYMLETKRFIPGLF